MITADEYRSIDWDQYDELCLDTIELGKTNALRGDVNVGRNARTFAPLGILGRRRAVQLKSSGVYFMDLR